MEEWKPLKYNGEDYGDKYLISDRGTVKNALTGRILKPTISDRGYCRVLIWRNKSKKKVLVRVHRAVAETFIDGYSPNLEVNHIDGNKLNNNKTNLEWVSHRDNIEHGYREGLYSKQIKVICVETGELFRSYRQASKWCGLENSTLLNYYFRNNKEYECIHPVTGKKVTLKPVENKEYVPYINPNNKDNCPICGNLKWKEAKVCAECRKNSHNEQRATKEELEALLLKNVTFVEIGKKYGVSDNAVRKWCKKYNLPYRKKDIENWKK